MVNVSLFESSRVGSRLRLRFVLFASRSSRLSSECSNRYVSHGMREYMPI